MTLCQPDVVLSALVVQLHYSVFLFGGVNKSYDTEVLLAWDLICVKCVKGGGVHVLFSAFFCISDGTQRRWNTEIWFRDGTVGKFT